MKKEDLAGFDAEVYNPFIRPKSEQLLREIVRENQPRQILEIGTYLGYSACVILEECEKFCGCLRADLCTQKKQENAQEKVAENVHPSRNFPHLTTLEKDEKNFEYAKKNLEKYGQNVTLFCTDAADFLKERKAEDGLFDLIFLDGPKAQYAAYLPHLKRLLAVGGTLVCDDVLFYGLVQGDGFVKHKHRTIVDRLRKFLADLEGDADFQTTIYDFEDGMSVSKKIR